LFKEQKHYRVVIKENGCEGSEQADRQGVT